VRIHAIVQRNLFMITFLPELKIIAGNLYMKNYITSIIVFPLHEWYFTSFRLAQILKFMLHLMQCRDSTLSPTSLLLCRQQGLGQVARKKAMPQN